MHCPRCGQEQSSADTKFCSRCGFQLDIVADLIANGGFLPQLAALNAGNSGLFTRRNGVIFSVFWFIFFLFIMTPIGGIANIDVLSAISAILGIFGGLMLLIASLVLLKRPTSIPKYVNPALFKQPQTLYGNQAQPALPPQQSQPASVYTAPQGSWKAPDTGELAVQGSITEGTTKLLSREEER